MDELTIMFYLASDNPLAPLVVSEIKAIKDAGFQKDTNVLVYFDPMEKGAPTQLLDINRDRKKRFGTLIGDGPDPFVRNMFEDRVDDRELSDELKKILTSSSEVSALDGLTSFVEFALEKRKAENYMLFLIGHGMVVGNDVFLPDDDPPSGITLKELKGLCAKFTPAGGENQLRLLALHSCSMSSIEVAYELRGHADYMLATQGTAFVNGWPYRQMLKKTLNQVKKAKEDHAGGGSARRANPDEVDYDHLINKLYFLCGHNFTDFMNAGYSCDLALCRLEPKGLDALRQPLQDLVETLTAALKLPFSVIKELVLLAHWDAQSFWSENYTDLFDFCDCLMTRCSDRATDLKDTGGSAATIEQLIKISGWCRDIKEKLAPESGESQGIVAQADICGSEFQYARGLSIYFPWCKPLDDERATFKSQQDKTERAQREAESHNVLAMYREYDFTKQFEDKSWLSFLETYFEHTKRAPLDRTQSARFGKFRQKFKLQPPETEGLVTNARTSFFEGVLKRTPELKRSPIVGGEDCTCPSIKNYPTESYKQAGNFGKFSITAVALEAFLPEEQWARSPEDDN